jgi:hypothetical protein
VPYIVVKSNGQEVDRRELDRGLVIGRAPDCDVKVHDILLSRRHCRLQPCDDGWIIQDLQSKNGTGLNGERIGSPRVLRDNDVIRFGRSKIIFHAGLPEEDLANYVSAPARPATPGDSLAGTLAGFTLLLPGEGEVSPDMPCPQPRPKDPPAYDGEELQNLLTAIASSSWDSVYAEARQPLRGGQGFELDEEVRERARVRPSSPTDLSLQASPIANVPAATPAVRQRRSGHGFQPWLHAAVGGVWVCMLVLLSLDHKPMIGGSVVRNGQIVRAANVVPVDDPNSNAGVGGDVRGELLNAADLETLEMIQPNAPAPHPIKFNAHAAENAVATLSLYLPLLW